MLQYLILLAAFPLGYALAKTTHDESPIYTKYFPTIKKILLVLIAISISQSQQILLTSLFMLLTIRTWEKS